MRKWIGFVLFLAALAATVFAQKAWEPLTDGLPVYRLHPLTVGVLVAVSVLFFGQLRPRWGDLCVLAPPAALAVIVTVARTLLLEQSAGVQVLVGNPPGISIVLTGLLIGACCLVGRTWLRLGFGGRVSALRALQLCLVVVLAAVLDALLLARLQLWWRTDSMGIDWHMRIVLPLFSFAAGAAVLLLLVQVEKIPLAMAAAGLVIAVFPYVVLLTGLTRASVPGLNLFTMLNFGPTAAVYGLFLGFALGCAIRLGQRRPAVSSAA